MEIVESDFGPKWAAKRIAGAIRDYVKASGRKGVALGVSGGVDSAVCAILAKKALGSRNVLGLMMPNGNLFPEEVEDAKEVCRRTGIRNKTINIRPAVEILESIVSSVGGKKPGNVEVGNIAARTRMVVLYGAASSKNYLVLGTGNKTELLLGYFTKYGDGGADILPIGDLYKWQVRELARDVGVPEKIVEKPPTAGLWSGQTDEGELGLAYPFADKVLSMFLEGGMNGRDIIKEVGSKEKVKKIHKAVTSTSHKRSPPRVFSLSLCRWV
ncbi:MAG: NAD+ synthase [Candidatus Micrarchaeota archaeon]